MFPLIQYWSFHEKAQGKRNSKLDDFVRLLPSFNWETESLHFMSTLLQLYSKEASMCAKSSKCPWEDFRAHSTQHIGMMRSLLLCVQKASSFIICSHSDCPLMHWISTSTQRVKLMLPSKKKSYVHITWIPPPREFSYKPDLYCRHSLQVDGNITVLPVYLQLHILHGSRFHENHF